MTSTQRDSTNALVTLPFWYRNDVINTYLVIVGSTICSFDYIHERYIPSVFGQ